MGLEQELWLIGVKATSYVFACRLVGLGSVGVTHFQVNKCSLLPLERDEERHFYPANLFFSTKLERIGIALFLLVNILCGGSQGHNLIIDLSWNYKGICYVLDWES